MAGKQVAETKILKIGGSVITDKRSFSTLNCDQIKRILKEIRLWLRDDDNRGLILVSGGGSFGHPLAHKYQLNNSSPNSKDPLGFLQTTTNMQKMGNLIARLAQEQQVPLLPISPSAVFLTDRGLITNSCLKAVEHALEAGLIPFFWGDTVFDKTHQFRVLSGDQINTYLCETLGIRELLYGTNVGGVYTDDPKKNPKAMLIPQINDKNYASVLQQVSFSNDTDVTGGMLGKLGSIHGIKLRPVTGTIFNGCIVGNTYKVLTGEKVGTLLEFS